MEEAEVGVHDGLLPHGPEGDARQQRRAPRPLHLPQQQEYLRPHNSDYEGFRVSILGFGLFLGLFYYDGNPELHLPQQQEYLHPPQQL